LLVDSKIVATEKLAPLRQECDELTAIFVTILQRAKHENAPFLILPFAFFLCTLPMHPSPIADTSNPPFPRIRFFIADFLLVLAVYHQPRGAKRFTPAPLHANQIAPQRHPARAIVRRLS
jgi:hypothetical protein